MRFLGLALGGQQASRWGRRLYGTAAAPEVVVQWSRCLTPLGYRSPMRNAHFLGFGLAAVAFRSVTRRSRHPRRQRVAASS